ncbi:MAG: hypothetical protein JXN65_10590 [Clostridia bacterium]|nr:hypothetical protein [Clostridia bacterium]
MNSKTKLILIIIVIVMLATVLLLLINHMACADGEAPQSLLSIDAKMSALYQAVIKPFVKAFDYVKYVFQKASAIQTAEYPSGYLPLYPDSRVLEYSFDPITNSLSIVSGTNDSFSQISSFYDGLFSGQIAADYLRQFKNESSYTIYGMIGNFAFLSEIQPSDSKKYGYEIDTELHYLKGGELAMENFFRKLNSSSAFIYSNPYIYMYQKTGDEQSIYLQLRDYKSQLLNLNTSVELYIDNELYAKRYYGDTIRMSISELSSIHRIMMVAYDSYNCIRAVDVMENALCYDASGQTDFYALVSDFSKADHLYIYNTESIVDISYLIYFSELKSLFLEGGNEAKNYTTILSLPSLKRLFIKDISDPMIYKLNVLNGLEVLQIDTCGLNLSLGDDFAALACRDIELINCPYLTFDAGGILPGNMERLSISRNYSLSDIAFVSAYPNMHVLELSDCDGMITLLNTSSLPNLNMLTISGCRVFDLSQPLSGMPMLMNTALKNNPTLASADDSFLNSFWASENVIAFSVSGCGNGSDIEYSAEPWKEAQ